MLLKKNIGQETRGNGATLQVWGKQRTGSHFRLNEKPACAQIISKSGINPAVDVDSESNISKVP
jgi:hypothetical protein